MLDDDTYGNNANRQHDIHDDDYIDLGDDAINDDTIGNSKLVLQDDTEADEVMVDIDWSTCMMKNMNKDETSAHLFPNLLCASSINPLSSSVHPPPY